MFGKRKVKTVFAEMLVAGVCMLCARTVWAETPATLGEPFAAAPDVPDTRYQAWPAAAWSPEANLWLVVWREGWLNTQETAIMAARVRPDGTSLDPAGIRVASASDIQDMPRVASDGKNFMVVWQDYRNGRDWDVYAARVTAEGTTPDGQGVLVAGGAHSQMAPDIAWAGGRYYAVWAGFIPQGQEMSGAESEMTEHAQGLFGAFGTRLSVEAKVEAPFLKLDHHAMHPRVAALGDNFLAIARNYSSRNRVRSVRIASATGERLGEPALTGWTHAGQPSALAMGASGGLIAYGNTPNRTGLFSIDSEGALSSEPFPDNKRVWPKPAFLLPPSLMDGGFGSRTLDPGRQRNDPQTRVLAWDGHRYVFAIDTALSFRGQPDKRRVEGWILMPDGTPAHKEPFVVAAESDYELTPAVSGGPEGTSLIVWHRDRGHEDCKIMARIVKTR